MFKELLDEIPWKLSLGTKEWTRAGSSLWMLSESSIPQYKKSRTDRKLAWLSEDLLVKLRDKKEMHRQ